MQRAQKAILHRSKESGEFAMKKKAKRSFDTQLAPRNTKSNIYKDADAAVLHMGLTDACTWIGLQKCGYINHFERLHQSSSRLALKESTRERRAVHEKCKSTDEVQMLIKQDSDVVRSKVSIFIL